MDIVRVKLRTVGKTEFKAGINC